MTDKKIPGSAGRGFKPWFKAPLREEKRGMAHLATHHPLEKDSIGCIKFLFHAHQR
jgi:hypothetical protein